MPTVHMIHQGGCAVAVIKYTDGECFTPSERSLWFIMLNGITSGTPAVSSRIISLARL